MDWLDELLSGQEAIPQAEPIARPAPRVVHTVWVQTRGPRNGDQGGTEAGHYFVTGDTVTMCDEAGEPTGKTHLLAAGENPRQIAGRLRRNAWLAEQGESDFNRPLNYSPIGLA